MKNACKFVPNMKFWVCIVLRLPEQRQRFVHALHRSCDLTVSIFNRQSQK